MAFLFFSSPLVNPNWGYSCQKNNFSWGYKSILHILKLHSSGQRESMTSDFSTAF